MSTGDNQFTSSAACSSAQPTIRLIRGGPEDVAELRRLWLRFAEQMGDATPSIPRSVPSDTWGQAREDHLTSLSHRDSFLLLAKQGRELVGYALVAVRYSGSPIEASGRRAYLDYLVALNRGTLITLVDEARRRVREARLARLWITLDRGANRVFYAERGFVVEQVTMSIRIDPERRDHVGARRHRRGRRGGRRRPRNRDGA